MRCRECEKEVHQNCGLLRCPFPPTKPDIVDVAIDLAVQGAADFLSNDSSLPMPDPTPSVPDTPSWDGGGGGFDGGGASGDF